MILLFFCEGLFLRFGVWLKRRAEKKKYCVSLD
jgi:hypothetical protein